MIRKTINGKHKVVDSEERNKGVFSDLRQAEKRDHQVNLKKTAKNKLRPATKKRI
jgi:hypothetical protein